jgi:hypothetical protein
MAESTTTATTTSTTFTPYATLAALGLYLGQIDFLAPIRDQVTIIQKKIVYTPFEKLTDAFVTILAGAHGMVEANTLLRSDTALQEAFGRTGCADQSTIQATLNACTDTNVAELVAAQTTIYRQHSQGYAHPYARRNQLLDVDLSGMPCGPKAAMGTKGYFAKQRNRRGRQLGRVLATRYGEIVTDQLFAGTMGLVKALIPLVEAAEQVLGLDEAKRQHTILRIDSGGGCLADVNWALARGYKLHTKEYSRQRARKLGQSVTTWCDDPQIPGRQVGWVLTPAPEYVRPVVRVAVRWKRKDGAWEYAVVISALTAHDVIAETNQPVEKVLDHQAVLLAYVQSYDARGGGVETSFKDDKQGLGITKRNKKRFAAQQIVTLLGSLAHNVIVWARHWLSDREPKVRRYGIKRMVRDIFHISGFLVRNGRGRIVEVVLNQRSPLVRGLSRGLDLLLRPAHIAINWGQI